MISSNPEWISLILGKDDAASTWQQILSSVRDIASTPQARSIGPRYWGAGSGTGKYRVEPMGRLSPARAIGR